MSTFFKEFGTENLESWINYCGSKYDICCAGTEYTPKWEKTPVRLRDENGDYTDEYTYMTTMFITAYNTEREQFRIELTQVCDGIFWVEVCVQDDVIVLKRKFGEEGFVRFLQDLYERSHVDFTDPQKPVLKFRQYLVTCTE